MCTGRCDECPIAVKMAIKFFFSRALIASIAVSVAGNSQTSGSLWNVTPCTSLPPLFTIYGNTRVDQHTGPATAYTSIGIPNNSVHVHNYIHAYIHVHLYSSEHTHTHTHMYMYIHLTT